MNELQKKRQQIQEMEAPPELEKGLRKALKPYKRKRQWQVFGIAAVACLLLVMARNYQVLAYYGQRFLGYEQLMTESLAKLNEEEKGQVINQSMELADGTLLIIDGVVSDTNRLYVYYYLKMKQV